MRATLIKSIVFAVVTVLATMVLAGTIRNGVSGEKSTYEAVFADATSVNRGDDVRMAGVKVGSVTDVEIVDNRRAKLTFDISHTAPMSVGTTAELRFRNLVGQRYVALHPPETPGEPLPAGYTFSLEETKPALDLTMLFNGFRPLFQLLSPEDINELSAQIIEVFQGEGGTVTGLLKSTARLTSTLADRDQVIGDLVTNLSAVLKVVNDRSSQLDTTLVTLQQLVSGLAADRETIGSAIEGMGELAQGVESLLDEGRAPLERSVDSLRGLSKTLADNEGEIKKFVRTLPTKLDRIGRLASYGSWVNFYLCSVKGKIPRPEGYLGDLGVRPVAGRCT